MLFGNPERKRGWTLAIAISVAVFGGFYSLISDISALLPFSQGMPSFAQVILRIVFSLTVAVVSFLVVYGTLYYRQLIAGIFGFITITDRWFPQELEARVEYSREIFHQLIATENFPLRIASVSGEWDICRPFTEKELRDFFKINQCNVRVLLAHPESNELRKRCIEEKKQDLGLMRSRIVHSTEYLTSIGGGKCQVKWYLTPSLFHIVASSTLMHFSPFVDGIPGHDTRRYVFSSDNPLYKAYIRWFDDTWERSLEPAHEMKWVSKQVKATRAIFLDRDDTLIKDICYFGSHDQVDIVILPHVIEGLKMLLDKGYRLIVVSNQQSVGLNLNNDRELALLTKRIKGEFESYGVFFDSFYYCKHSVSQECNCRKPKPQLFEMAVQDFSLNLNECHFIGDSDADRGVGSYLPELKIHIINESHDFLAIAKEICSSRIHTG